MARQAAMTDTSPDVRIVTYAARHADAFARLNLEWIEKFFEVEQRDEHVLQDPEQTILDSGGEVFFLLRAGVPVGTVALQAIEDGYELTKMAVTSRHQGRGYGDRLLVAALDWASARGVERIILHSNTRLEPAIRLYRKYGFRTVRTGSFDGWARSNIRMQRDLGANPRTPSRPEQGRAESRGPQHRKEAT
jgi:GNAT superfamily N-acetyltransferase